MDYTCAVRKLMITLLGQRNVVEVEWLESRIRNLYRAGHKGRVSTVLLIDYPSNRIIYYMYRLM